MIAYAYCINIISYRLRSINLIKKRKMPNKHIKTIFLHFNRSQFTFPFPKKKKKKKSKSSQSTPLNPEYPRSFNLSTDTLFETEFVPRMI